MAALWAVRTAPCQGKRQQQAVSPLESGGPQTRLVLTYASIGTHEGMLAYVKCLFMMAILGLSLGMRNQPTRLRNQVH